MKRKEWFAFLLLCAFFAVLLLFPELSGQATYAKLLFFGKTVFPALFVSLCISGMLVTSHPARLLYRFPFGVEGTVLLFGILCGFPVGARSAMLLYEAGQISKERAEFLCGFSNLASLPFLTGVVGHSLFGDTSFGMHLALVQAVASLLTASVLYAVLRPDCGGLTQTPHMQSKGLAASIASGAHTMVELGGMLIVFGVAADLLLRLTGLDGIPAALLQGALEFSSGCASASEIGGIAGETIASLSVGLSGLCVASQISSVTKGKLSLRPYVLGKGLQAAFMTVLLWLS